MGEWVVSEARKQEGALASIGWRWNNRATGKYVRGGRTATPVRELTERAVDELTEKEAEEVLDFIGHSALAAGGNRPVLILAEQWQERYRLAMANLAQVQFCDLVGFEDLLAELNTAPTSKPGQHRRHPDS